MIEVATFLLDLDRITEPALQRIASIALRQINNSSYSIGHDQLVRRIRNLSTDDQDLFLEELKRLLVNMLSEITTTQQRQPTFEPTTSSDDVVRCVDITQPRNMHVTEQIPQRSPSIVNNELEEEEARGVEMIGSDKNKSHENEDLAEADQKCCLMEDGAGSATNSHEVNYFFPAHILVIIIVLLFKGLCKSTKTQSRGRHRCKAFRYITFEDKRKLSESI